MSKLKVDLLSKSELIYELKVRGCPKDDIVQNLRKDLRELLKLGVKENVKNLESFNLKEELAELEVQLNEIKQNAIELKNVVNLNKVVRLECKLEHYARRVNNAKSFNSKKEEEKIERLNETVEEIKSLLAGINCSQEDKTKVVEILEKSFQEEDELSEHINNASIGDKKVVSDKTLVVNEGACMFAKLKNPVEQYLSLFKPTDGLVVDLLLNFIKVLLVMSDETQLKADEILGLSLSFCKGPLRAKILESLSEGHDIERVHGILINHFVPISLRESLKRDFVLRPQRFNENLSEYILEIKLYARLLKCQYNESELVQLIIIGLNEKTRSYMVFAQRPSSFNDLDQLVVHCGNVEYSNLCRRRENPGMTEQLNYRGRFNNRINSGPIKCYNCGKMGHVARNCYRPNNGQEKSKATVQKNV